MACIAVPVPTEIPPAPDHEYVHIYACLQAHFTKLLIVRLRL